VLGDLPGGRRHRSQRAQDPAGDEPAKRARDHGHESQCDPGLQEPGMELIGGTLDEPAEFLVRVGVWMLRPVRDDHVDPGVMAEEQVHDHEQHHSRDEEQSAVEQSQAQADGP
jgi:hypothetical protein